MGTTFGGGFLREDIHGVPKNDSGQNPDESRRIYEEGGRGKEEIFKDKVDFLLVMYERRDKDVRRIMLMNWIKHIKVL